MTIQVYLHKRFQEKLDDSSDVIQTKVNYVINQLENQTYYDVTKLAPYKDLYRAKVDQGETRILFYVAKEKAKQKKVLLVVDLITKHYYHKSIYLKHSIDIDEDVLKRIKIQDIVPDMELEDKLQNGSTIDRKTRSIVISKDKAITLIKDQEDVLAGKLPAIVHGVAGSGKTSVALEIIRKMVDDLNKKDEKEIEIKVVYISLSENLVKEVEKSYWNTEEQEDSNKDQVSQTQVEFLTYDSFLKKQPGSEEIRGKKPIDRKVFLLWFEQKSKKKEYKKYKDLGDQIFEEFSAVITASHTKKKGSSDSSSDASSLHKVTNNELKDNYYNLGVKQSIFVEHEDRKKIFKLYLKYRKYILNNKEYYDSNIMTHQLVHNISDQEELYDLVVVDEAQDFTECQQRLILKSSKKGKIIWFCDKNQVIHPSLFSESTLKTSSYDEGHPIIEYSLNDNHRNSPMVKWLLNGLSHVKEQLFPISSKKQSTDVRSTSEQSPPESTARYLILTDQHKKHIIQEIKTSIQLVVIALNDDCKEKAKKIFPNLLVFNVYEIKGLEYPHVILFNFFSGNKDPFDKIHNYINKKSAASLEIEKAESKDKGDKSRVGQLKLGLNFLYVAISRGKETVSIVEEDKCKTQNKTLIGYLKQKGHLKKTSSITQILEGNVEDSLSDLKDEAMKLAIRGNTEQARAILNNIKKKYIDGNNNESKQEAEKYIQEIEDRIKSDGDKVNSQSTNDTESNNDKLKKIQVSEPKASTSYDNSSSIPEHSTGAIPKKRTPIAPKVSHSIQNETSKKSSKKQNKKYTKKSTIESRADKENKDENIIKYLQEKLKTSIEKCTENKISEFIKDNLEKIKQLNQESRNKLFKAFSVKNTNLLHYAAEKNCIDVAKFIVKNKLFDVNFQSDDGMTPLHYAAVSGSIEVTSLLLDNEANANAKANDGMTPLHYVAVGGNIELDQLDTFTRAAPDDYTEVFKLLLTKKVDVNAKVNNGMTSLHFAAMSGNIAVTRLLLDNGANVNAQASDGMMPLHYAAASGVIEVAQPNTFTKAAQDDYTEVFKLLLAKKVDVDVDVNAKANNGMTLLHCAAWGGNIDVTRLLIANGANVNAKANNGMTLLHCAAWCGNIDITILLIANGANVNVKTNDGTTSLHLAAWIGNIEVTRLLIANRAKVNVKTSDGMTPLHCAVQCRSIELTSLLVDNGANVNAQISNGMTPLHCAVQCGSTELTSLLIFSRANVNAQTSGGMIPLHCAIQGGHQEISSLLLDNGSDVNAQASDGTTPLHFAAYYGHKELAELLLLHNAKVNAIQNDGLMPLHIAAHNWDIELVKLFCAHGTEYEQLMTKANSQISNRLQMSKKFYEAVKSFWEKKLQGKDTNAKFKEIAGLLYDKKNDGILLDVYHTVGKNNAITLATKCKDPTLLQLLLDYAVKIMQINLVKDLLSIKDDNGKLLLGTEYVKDLLSELKNDEQGADAERKEKIIEILTAAIGNLLPTNASEVDSNSASEDSDAGESKLYHEGITGITDSEIEIEMNDNNELENIPLGIQSQNWHYKDNVQRVPCDNNNGTVPEGFYTGEAAGRGDCFFDAVAQGLNQLMKKNISTKDLRKICSVFFMEEHHDSLVQKMKRELKNAIEQDGVYKINEYVPRIAFTADDITKDEAAKVLKLKGALWGRPEIEGRIICFYYNVKLHLRERYYLNGTETYTDQLITTDDGSKSVDSEYCYKETNIVHIYNGGHQHFVPILQDSNALLLDSDICTQQQQSNLRVDTSALIDGVSNIVLPSLRQNDTEHEQTLIAKLPEDLIYTNI